MPEKDPNNLDKEVAGFTDKIDQKPSAAKKQKTTPRPSNPTPRPSNPTPESIEPLKPSNHKRSHTDGLESEQAKRQKQKPDEQELEEVDLGIDFSKLSFSPEASQTSNSTKPRGGRHRSGKGVSR